MAYDVVLDAGKTVVITDTPIVYSQVYAPNIANFAPIVRTIKSNDYGSVTANVAGDPIPAPATESEQYFVRMFLNNGMHEDIKLGDLASQAGWTNNMAGYTAAVKDIAQHAVG